MNHTKIQQPLENEKMVCYLNELVTIHFLSPQLLKPTEKHDPAKVSFLAEKISTEGIWCEPLLLERDTHIIMDGHHRYRVAKALNLSIIPCLRLTYSNPHLTVKSRMPNKDIQPENIIQAGLTGNLLAYKSTRHQLAVEFFNIRIPLLFLY